MKQRADLKTSEKAKMSLLLFTGHNKGSGAASPELTLWTDERIYEGTEEMIRGREVCQLLVSVSASSAVCVDILVLQVGDKCRRMHL